MTLKFPKVLSNRQSYGEDFKKDCVFTHPEAIISLGKYGVLDRDMTYVEPSCGTGNLSFTLEKNGYQVDSFDKLNWGYGQVKALSEHEPNSYDIAITNPPYSIWEIFLRGCLAIARRHVFLLFPTRYLEGQHRVRVFQETRLTNVYVLSYRVKMYNSEGSRLSGMTSYSWFHWDLCSNQTSPSLHWLFR